MIPGCASAPDTVYVEPDCIVAPVPEDLPRIDARELYTRVGPEMYAKLIRRENKIVDWALENQAELESICGGNDGSTEG